MSNLRPHMYIQTLDNRFCLNTISNYEKMKKNFYEKRETGISFQILSLLFILRSFTYIS